MSPEHADHKPPKGGKMPKGMHMMGGMPMKDSDMPKPPKSMTRRMGPKRK